VILTKLNVNKCKHRIKVFLIPLFMIENAF